MPQIIHSQAPSHPPPAIFAVYMYKLKQEVALIFCGRSLTISRRR